MTAEFGDFANINVERVIEQAKNQASAVMGMQEKLTSLVGRAESEDGHIKVAFESAGLSELEINPRAMRMGSAELAATIKQLVREASDDLQRQIREEIGEAFAGQDNPMEILDDPTKAAEKMKDIHNALNSATGDVSDFMEKMRKQLNL